MRDHDVSVKWCKESQTYNVRLHREEGDGYQRDIWLFSFSIGEMTALMDGLNIANIEKAKVKP